MNRLKPTYDSLLSYFDEWTLRKGADCLTQNKIRFERFVLPNGFTGFVAGTGATFHRASVTLSDNLSVIDSSTCSCGPKRDCEHRAALTLACLQLPEYQNAEKSAQSPQYRDEKKSAQSLQYDDADKSELLPAAEQTCSELAKSATEQTGSEQVQSATELFCPKQGELPSDLSVDEPDAQLNPTAINTLSNRAVKSKQTARSKRRYSKRAVSRMRTTARTISTNHTQAPSRGRVTHSVNSTRFVNSSRSASSPDTNVVSADSILSSALNVRLKALSEALQNHRLDIGQDMQKNCKVPSVTLLGGINPTESRKFILETA